MKELLFILRAKNPKGRAMIEELLVDRNVAGITGFDRNPDGSVSVHYTPDPLILAHGEQFAGIVRKKMTKQLRKAGEGNIDVQVNIVQ
jgi:hypothetical protein